MILTDAEIRKEWMKLPPGHFVDIANDFARAIESAVLEKLKVQEPMCWTNDTELSYSQFKRPDGELTSGSFWAEYHEDCDTPLYTNPLPPADVVRDAERYRWLRDECVPEKNPNHTWIVEAPGDMWDAAIDAAMKEMK